MSYQDYCHACPDYVIPDVVCAFNCGFHEFSKEPKKEQWAPALPLLTRHVGVPLIFTSYTATEAQRDYDLLCQSTSHDLDSNGRTPNFKSLP